MEKESLSIPVLRDAKQTPGAQATEKTSPQMNTHERR
jgi:hypothetical protein